MSSFKDKLKKLFTDTYNCNYYNNIYYNPKPKNYSKISTLYSYSKIIHSMNLLNKNTSFKDTPTKIIDNFQSNNINHFNKFKNIHNYNTISNNHNFNRSHSYNNLNKTNYKLKNKISYIKNNIQYSNYRNINNIYNNINDNISYKNKPIRNLSCKLFDVNSTSIINNNPINYKIYNTIDFKNSSNILRNNNY